MKNRVQRVESLDRMLRADARRGRLGEGVCCSGCGYADTEALQPDSAGAVCYECARLREGQSAVERHHVLGKANSEETVLMPGNLHRWLSDQQRDWPEELQRNDWRDPLLTIAAVIRAITDFAVWIARHGEQFADWLLQLRSWLVQNFGPRWWEQAQLPGLWAT
jgi:hypothetical protein